MTNTRYGIEVLHWAGMKDEFLPQLQELLQEYPEFIHFTNKYGENAIHIATRVNNIEIFKWLIKNTDINYHAVIDKGNVLLVAIESNSIKIIEFLLNETDIDYKVLNSEGKGIFHLLMKLCNDNLIENVFNIYPEGINLLDNNNENCLFDFINYFSKHKKYYMFNMLQEMMSPEIFNTVNNNNQNLLDFTLSIIEDSTSQIEKILKEEMYSPLISQLEFYLQESDN